MPGKQNVDPGVKSTISNNGFQIDTVSVIFKI